MLEQNGIIYAIPNNNDLMWYRHDHSEIIYVRRADRFNLSRWRIPSIRVRNHQSAPCQTKSVSAD